MRMPIDNPIITSCFGPRIFSDGRENLHSGVDFTSERVRSGAPTYAFAVAEAIVEDVAYEPDGFGHYVVLKAHDHMGRQRLLYYCHLHHVTVSKGDALDVGDLVGQVGNTGNSHGAHLHFEVRTARGSKYNAVDPTEFLGIPNVDGEVSLYVRLQLRDGQIISVAGMNVNDRNLVFLTEVPYIVQCDTMESILWDDEENVPYIK